MRSKVLPTIVNSVSNNSIPIYAKFEKILRYSVSTKCLPYSQRSGAILQDECEVVLASQFTPLCKFSEKKIRNHEVNLCLFRANSKNPEVKSGI